LEQAECLYQAILRKEPGQARALHLLGMVHAARHKPILAIDLIRKSIKSAPLAADTHCDLGRVLWECDRRTEALECFRRAVSIRPDIAALQLLLANAYHAQNRTDLAIECYRRATSLDARDPKAHYDLGNLLQSLHRYEEAIECYANAIAIAPGLCDGHNNLGLALVALDRPSEALPCFESAVACRPEDSKAINNLGNVLLRLRRPYEAAEAFTRAIALAPTDAELRNNLGNALWAIGQPNEALDCYEAALRINPSASDTHVNASQVRLACGDFENGWREYEWRLASRGNRRHKQDGDAEWRGEASIEGQRLLLYAEQGFGDTLQFARYASIAAARGARVTLAVQPPLRRLLSSLVGVDEVVHEDTMSGSFDLQCPLMSLPLAFGTRLNTIPGNTPYLFASPEKLSQWSQELRSLQRPLVGLAWAGNPQQGNDENRSIEVQSLSPLLALPGLSFVGLQKDLRQGDDGWLAQFPHVLNVGPRLQDFDDTAAVISQLDVIISVDSAVAHAAGALGVPVWLLLAFAADWRWLLQRTDSPWYPAMRLFRQEAIGDWPATIERVKQELVDFARVSSR
jgi:tetratricopeptide (TPR) repeat protein